jgi:hypothetical protein
VVDAGAELESLLVFLGNQGIEIERAGRPRVRRAVVVRVQQARELISPAYDHHRP